MQCVSHGEVTEIAAIIILGQGVFLRVANIAVGIIVLRGDGLKGIAFCLTGGEGDVCDHTRFGDLSQNRAIYSNAVFHRLLSRGVSRFLGWFLSGLPGGSLGGSTFRYGIFFCSGNVDVLGRQITKNHYQCQRKG